MFPTCHSTQQLILQCSQRSHDVGTAITLMWQVEKPRHGLWTAFQHHVHYTQPSPDADPEPPVTKATSPRESGCVPPMRRAPTAGRKGARGGLARAGPPPSTSQLINLAGTVLPSFPGKTHCKEDMPASKLAQLHCPWSFWAARKLSQDTVLVWTMPYVHPTLINRLAPMAHQVPDLPRLSVIEQNRPCISAEVHVFHSPGGALWGQQGDRWKPGQPQPGQLAQSWRDGPFQRWSLPFLTVTPQGRLHKRLLSEYMQIRGRREERRERRQGGRG